MTSRGSYEKDLSDFLAGWDQILQENEQLPVLFAIMALTNFGGKPVSSAHLAKVLVRSVSEVEARASGHCTSGAPVDDGFIRVENGLVTYINPDRANPAPRRLLQLGDDRFGMIGCGFDVFLYAPLVDLPLRVEETCTVTGTPIRVMFGPNGVRSVEPDSAVVPIPSPKEFDLLSGLTVQQCDANCATSPFYSSAEAALDWLDHHPDGEVFPVRTAWNLSFHRLWRKRMKGEQWTDCQHTE